MLGLLLVGAFAAATCTQQGTLPSIPNAPTGSTSASQGGGLHFVNVQMYGWVNVR
jgi:hypothetical protein